MKKRGDRYLQGIDDLRKVEREGADQLAGLFDEFSLLQRDDQIRRREEYRAKAREIHENTMAEIEKIRKAVQG